MNTNHLSTRDQAPHDKPNEQPPSPNGKAHGPPPRHRSPLERQAERLGELAPTEEVFMNHMLMRSGRAWAEVYTASIGGISSGPQPSLEAAVSSTELLYRTQVAMTERLLAERRYRPKSETGGAQ